MVDDGIVPADLTLGQTHLRRAREPACQPAQSLCRNLLYALPFIQSDWIIVLEDDDHYAPTHLETLMRQLQSGASIVGDDTQRYYNVAHRVWRVYQNRGASLCQTGFHRRLLALLTQVLMRRLTENHYGVDGAFWEAVPKVEWSLEPHQTVVGIKGLPGRKGLGVGHRPGAGWTQDPTGEKLRAWTGADASRYLPFQVGVE